MDSYLHSDLDPKFLETRAKFYIPEKTIYLDGNSLGLMSMEAETELLSVANDWKTLGVEGWSKPDGDWFHMAERLGALTAPLIGAEPDEVIVTNSTTVNLHQILTTLFPNQEGKTDIIVDKSIFPSDEYAITSFLNSKDLPPEKHLIKIAPSKTAFLDENDVVEAISPQTAIVLLPGVVYTTGQLMNMATISTAARKLGVVVGFDLSHSIGSVPHDLSEWDVDFAFWCGYKYLNGGPGAAGGIYLNRQHFSKAPGIAGWFGADKSAQFQFSPDFRPAYGAARLQIGTPNILSMAPLLGSLPLILSAGIDWIRERSLALTDYLIDLCERELAPFGFEVVSPRDPSRRGGHVSITHPDALEISRALRAKGVVPDFRPPNVIRFAPVALYNSFADCSNAVQITREIVYNESYRGYSTDQNAVT